MLTKVSISWIMLLPIVQEILKQVQDDVKTKAVMLTKVSISWIILLPIVQEILKQVQDEVNKFRMTETSSG